jgi:hypothetical protein
MVEDWVLLWCCHVADTASAPLASVRMHSRVLAMSWLPPSEQQLDLQGNSLLAVLHEFSRESSAVYSGVSAAVATP